MLSEAPVKRTHQDAFTDIIPTASHKAVHLDTTRQDGSEYKNKPMSQWKYEDVASFFLDGRMSDVDFNFSAISGVKGSELPTLSRAVFQRLSLKYGDELYDEVQRRALQERGALNQHFPASISSTSTPSITTSSSSSSSSPLFSPSFIFTTSPHNHLSPHLAPQPSVICDAQAPYELRIEPMPQQPPLALHRGAGGSSRFNFTPTAALKSHPPPLMALDSGGREGRREVTADGDASRGGGGEQGHPAQEEVKVEPPKKRGPGRPKKPENELKKKKKKTGRLWEFIRNLLLDPETCPSLVRWENPEEGLFRFIDGEKVAKRWGERKQNKEMNYEKLSRAMSGQSRPERKQNNDMNYEKLSRAMRYYYKTHIFEAVIGRRLVYKFGKKATGWRPSNPNFSNLQNLSTPQEPPPPVHHHTESTSQLHHYTDSISQIHSHSDTKPQLHHHSDSLSQLHHHSDPHPPPAHHHQDTAPPQHHQLESQFLSSPPQISLHQENTTPSPTHRHHHTHTLQGHTVHHHHHQHPHHNT